MVARLYTLIVFAGLLSGPAIVLSAMSPDGRELLLVVGPDASFREQLVADAGGQIVGPQQAAFGSFAVSEYPRFIATQKASGIWLVIDGRQFARLCGVEI